MITMTQVDSKKTSWLQETNPQEGNFMPSCLTIFYSH